MTERRQLQAGAGIRHRGREREPCHQSGQRDAGGHIVVDADHIGAQPRVDRDLVRAIAGPGGREIPIEVGHGINPWVVPVTYRARRSTSATWRESSAKAASAPDGCDPSKGAVTNISWCLIRVPHGAEARQISALFQRFRNTGAGLRPSAEKVPASPTTTVTISALSAAAAAEPATKTKGKSITLVTMR